MDQRQALHRAQRGVTSAPYVLGLYVALAVGAVLGQYLKTAAHPGAAYPQYNGYLILKHSFVHLLNHQNLYAWYLQEHWDLYKYSPTCAVLFAPLSVVPDWLGMVLWNVLNACCLFWAIQSLPGVRASFKASVLFFSGLALFLSLQHFQINGVLAALMIGSVALRMREYICLATLCVVASLFIKIFGVFAVVVLLVFPHRRKAVLCALLWVLVLAAVPLLVVSASQVWWQYGNWLQLLQEDHTAATGTSLLRWLPSGGGLAGPTTLIQVTGIGLLGLPLLNTQAYADWGFRLGLLSSVLMWVIIFNHKAETATFVIAVCGCALWYATSQGTWLDTALILAVALGTCLSPTALVPLGWRKAFFKPYALEVVPVIGTWIKLNYDLFVGAHRGQRPLRVLDGM